MRTILFLVLLVFFVLCFSLFTGCANQGRYVQGPDGNTHYQLPASRDHEDHCRTASRFAKRVAQSRSHPEFMDGMESKDVPPETVQLTIYSECIEKRANKTWFPNQATSNAQ